MCLIFVEISYPHPFMFTGIFKYILIPSAFSVSSLLTTFYRWNKLWETTEPTRKFYLWLLFVYSKRKKTEGPIGMEWGIKRGKIVWVWIGIFPWEVGWNLLLDKETMMLICLYQHQYSWLNGWCITLIRFPLSLVFSTLHLIFVYMKS